MKKFVLILITFVLVMNCRNESGIEADVQSIEMDIKLERFDKLFAESQPENLSELKASYPFMFSRQFTDADYRARLNDTLQQQLYQEVKNTFETIPEFDDILNFYRHFKYHYQGFESPRLITVVSDVDYRNRVIVTDTIALIGLDNYLGAEHEFYGGIQQYISQNLKREMMVSDLAEAYAEKMVPRPVQRNFLADMIYFGKRLYFKDRMIPFEEDEIRIGYSKDQLEWAKANESNIWRYFVENELLYDNDLKLTSRFINPAPFSKFNLELDNESPGRIGQYIGWQIVRSYMQNNEIGFREMMLKDADEIFKNARFKPRR
ncbi:MAG: gliding motility lipoprotein GldB [Flavobacteriaceae bacterium]|nr:gliding motility lipoprotein GldB [Flavobacteriaceae bacterium]